MSQIGEEKLWTVEDMAEFCQVKPSVVRYWLRNTDIPFIRLGKQIRFEPEKMKEWVKEKSARTGSNCIEKVTHLI